MSEETGNFLSRIVNFDAIKVFYLPTDAQMSCFKRILKFSLKQLLHVSVQTPASGSVLFEVAKVIIIKITLIPNSAPHTHTHTHTHTHQYGPNKIRNHTTEPTTTMYFN
jgi:hypothetical protein